MFDHYAELELRIERHPQDAGLRRAILELK